MQTIKFLFGTAAVAGVLAPALIDAAVLTNVPMQGGMVMPLVSYHADDGRIHVKMPSAVPQLTPLLVSHPGDSFDPADPWFDALDPSRGGGAFSRRYGFVMDGISDPLPANTQMWIRKLSETDDLKIYRYFGSVPKMFEPIFGTDGATNAIHWNALMFHPLMVAPPGTNGYTATFEVYLLDITNGQEIPNSGSGVLTFNLTNVPDGRPVLSLAQDFVVSWASDVSANWVLESATRPDATMWMLVPQTPVVVDGRSTVSLDANEPQRFFRMRYQP